MTATMWLHEPLEHWIRVQPEAEFLVLEGTATTYGDAGAAIDRMAGALARDLEPGDRFAIMSRNSLDMLLLYYAASKAGVVPVPVNFRLTAPEVAHIVNDSGARLTFAQAEYVATIDELRPQCPAVGATICFGPAPSAQWRSLEGWFADPISAAASRLRRHDEALQIYTSGTTGRPKGAVLTQAGLANLLLQWRICFPFAQGERLLLTAPLYHVGGTFNSFHAQGHGGSVFLYADFDAAEVVRALDEERIGMGFLVPSMIQGCLAVPGVEERQFEHFRLLSYGASPISDATLARALDVFGCDFVQSFGMTECPCVTYLTAEDHRRALAGFPHLLESTGRVGPGSDIRIVDRDGHDLGAGQVGEILGRGPQLMSGYWNMPAATAEALDGGWMHTGDAGSLDPEGYLYVKDRIKDMIVSGAENVYPREIEEVLLTHPAVADAAVIGVPSDTWGETVMAFVVVRPDGATSPEDLIEFCRTRLAGYKRPRTVVVIEEIPRNPSGKALKRVLREPYWAGRTRRVS